MAADFQAEKTLVLDIRELTSIADYFVIATCASERLLGSLAEEIRVTCKQLGRPPHSIEGLDTAWWVLLDFGDVIVHLLQEEARRFYDLEVLWGDAPRLEI